MKLTDTIHLLGDGLFFGARLTALTGSTWVLDSVVVTNPGAGYTGTPTVDFSAGGGTGAAATAVVLDGSVLDIVLTNPGSGYTSAPTVALTGGGYTTQGTASAVLAPGSLDSILTAARSVNNVLLVPVWINGLVSWYHLRAGTDAEASPYIIRPDDYNGATNQKVWELVTHQRLMDTQAAKVLGYAGSVALDFTASGFQTIPITGDITFTTANRAAGRRITLRIQADASGRSFTLPAWVWVAGTAPTGIAANKTGILTLICYGANDTDIVARWDVQS